MSVGNHKKKVVRAPHLGPERRRPQILDTALELVARDGVRAVHMEAVAQAMGVTKPVVYACFASREDLLNALLEREEQRLFEGVMAALPRKVDIGNPQQLMSDGFRALFKAVDNNRDSWRLVFSVEADPAVAARLQEGRQLVAQRVSMLVGAWLKLLGAKEAKKRLPVLVTMFMSICEGMVRSLLEGQHGWTIDELAAYVGRLVLAAFEEA
ncbi:MAG: TetR/AcrR family transcriptional regulator [Cupriavidus sp.]|nr:MAG: TetR/AcrR family transcriptional regulator [Cupriavidus sp.]